MTPIADDVDISRHSNSEIRVSIMRLTNNKAAGAVGLPAELFKAGGNGLIGCTHQLLCKIWLKEGMPNDWRVSFLSPILKKGDLTSCANNAAISYKFLSSVICKRLNTDWTLSVWL